MFVNFEKLAGLGSEPLGERLNKADALREIPAVGQNQLQLVDLLGEKNGFYAFESALHVLPFSVEDAFRGQDLLRWNKPDLWKSRYGLTEAEMYCFAEDVFGCQFYCTEIEVGRFDPETGEKEALCRTISEWATLLLEDYAAQTGYKVARDWQRIHGPIRPGNRLVPIYPLVTEEGSYELENFYEVDSLKGLLSRSDFAATIKNLRDGTKVRLLPTNIPGSRLKDTE